MIQVRLLSCDSDRKIKSVKAVRFVTGLGLKDALGVFDSVVAGANPVINLGDEYGIVHLRDQSFVLMRMPGRQPDHDLPYLFERFLDRLPQDMSLRDVRSVLSAVNG